MPGLPERGMRIAPEVTKPLTHVAPRSRTRPGATHLGYRNTSRFTHRPRESEHPVDLETVTRPRSRLRPSHVPGVPKPKSPPVPGTRPWVGMRYPLCSLCRWKANKNPAVL